VVRQRESLGADGGKQDAGKRHEGTATRWIHAEAPAGGMRHQDISGMTFDTTTA